jgi:ATP-dependent Lon protease
MKTGESRVFYVKKKVIFPRCSISVQLTRSPASEQLNTNDNIIAFPLNTYLDLLFYKRRMATLSEVTSIEPEKDRIRLQLKGLGRVRIKKMKNINLAEYEPVDDIAPPVPDSRFDELRRKAQELIFLINVEESDRLISLLNFLVDSSQMTDFIANYFVIDYKKRYRLLNEIRVVNRTKKLVVIINDLIGKMKNRFSRKI